MFERSRNHWRKNCAGSSQKLLDHRLSRLLCVQAKQANCKAGIPQLLQELLKRQYPVRVLYTAGHWLDINSIEDVVQAGNF